MDALTFLTWVIGLQTTVFIFIFGYITHKMDKIEEKLSLRADKIQEQMTRVSTEVNNIRGELLIINKRLDKLDESNDKIYTLITMIHTDNQVIKSILNMKDGCVLNHKHSEKVS